MISTPSLHNCAPAFMGKHVSKMLKNYVNDQWIPPLDMGARSIQRNIISRCTGLYECSDKRHLIYIACWRIACAALGYVLFAEGFLQCAFVNLNLWMAAGFVRDADCTTGRSIFMHLCQGFSMRENVTPLFFLLEPRFTREKFKEDTQHNTGSMRAASYLLYYINVHALVCGGKLLSCRRQKVVRKTKR